jgi:hypothetical protein
MELFCHALEDNKKRGNTCLEIKEGKILQIGDFSATNWYKMEMMPEVKEARKVSSKLTHKTTP